MEAISEIQSNVDAELQSPQAQQTPGSAVVSDVPPESGDAVPDPGRLPDICNLEWQREGMPNTEFNRKYPPDPWGEEMAPNARVWNVYRDHQTISDRGILDTWNKTLDVLLIFAGLFSAVSTAFLIESYKSLQPDYTQYVAAFLYAAAISLNRTHGVLPALDVIDAPDRFIQTSSLQRWTNGLWFSSLVTSLAVALLCILVKQWLDEYVMHVSSEATSTKHWARRHRMYYRGLEKWGVPGLISFLPVLLHIALFFFFVGLVLFLLPLDGTIAYSLLVMVSCILAFYILSIVLPAWHVECPSYTPILAKALLAVSRGTSILLNIIGPVPFWRRSFMTVWSRRATDWLESIQLRAGQQLTRETASISACAWQLDGQVLSALIHLPTHGNMDAVNAAFAAMGAITSTHTIDVLLRKVPEDVFWAKLSACLDSFLPPQSGFALTSRAQLHRAYMARSIQDTGPACLRLKPPCVPSLGIDGLLLQGLRIEDADRQRSGIDVLISQLQSLPLGGDPSCGFPLRSSCLLFLDGFAQGQFWKIFTRLPLPAHFLCWTFR